MATPDTNSKSAAPQVNTNKSAPETATVPARNANNPGPEKGKSVPVGFSGSLKRIDN